MKTKEFIKRVEELGFEVMVFNNHIHILANNFTISVAYINRERAINTYKPILIDFKNEDKLFDIMIEYAKTPIEDREEEKKFWIQHKFMVSKNLLPVNLVWNKLKDVYRSINLKVDSHIYQAQFTFKEYEEIKKKLNTDLKDFELVEVKK